MENESKSLVWANQQADAQQRMREGGGAPGLAGMGQIAGKSGREILDAMMSGGLQGVRMKIPGNDGVYRGSQAVVWRVG